MEIFANNGALECRLILETEQDILNNCTALRLTRVDFRKLDQGLEYGAWCTGTVTADGIVLKEFILSSIIGYGVNLQTEWNGFDVSASPVSISHSPDGSSIIPIRLNLTLKSRASSTFIGSIGKTVQTELPRIPRVSAISAEAATLGGEMTITLDRASESFRDSLIWVCGEQSGVLAENSSAVRFCWTPPVALASESTDSPFVPVTLRVTTFAEGEAIGTGELTVNCQTPETMIPTLTVSVSDALGYAADCGGYVQNHSLARVVTQAQGVYGSVIRQVAVSCGSIHTSGADVTFVPDVSGTAVITVTVTDSRGRSARTQQSIRVLPYRIPEAIIRQFYRCNASGEAQPDGNYLRLVFDASMTALSGNSAEYRAICRVHGGSESREVLLTDYAGAFTVTGGSVVLPAGIDSGYDCLILARDRFETGQSQTVWVSVAFVLLDLCRQTRAVGIGMRAGSSDKLSVGLDTDMGEHRLGNLAEPEYDADAATKAYVDSCIRTLAQTLGVTI